MYRIEDTIPKIDLPQRDLSGVQIGPDGRPSAALDLHLHPGQYAALMSESRFILVLAGTQGGKTSFGPYWMLTEMAMRGPGDYLAVSPYFSLAATKLIPEYQRLFEHRLRIGEYRRSPVPQLVINAWGRRFLRATAAGLLAARGADPALNPWPEDDSGAECVIRFGYAAKPESLESMTALAAHLDECGQSDFKLGSWEAIRRRLSLAQGRVLMTTTPYNLGWLKTQVYDKWKAAPGLPADVGYYIDQRGELRQHVRERHDHPEIDVIRFESIMNPSFPIEEFEAARRTMAKWKFDMFYRGIFTRPAGLIYDCFDETHVIEPFPIPRSWPRYLGMDFGGVNTAATFFARRPGDGALILYRTYHEGNRSIEQHVAAITAGEPEFASAWGGAPGEIQWRRELKKNGLNVRRPRVTGVEVGISRVYAQHLEGNLLVFDNLPGYLDEKHSYSRELGPDDQPVETIANKSIYHLLDAERYVISSITEPESIDAHANRGGTYP